MVDVCSVAPVSINFEFVSQTGGVLGAFFFKWSCRWIQDWTALREQISNRRFNVFENIYSFFKGIWIQAIVFEILQFDFRFKRLQGVLFHKKYSFSVFGESSWIPVCCHWDFFPIKLHSFRITIEEVQSMMNKKVKLWIFP